MGTPQHYLMLQTPDIDTLYVAYLSADPATRRAVDAAVQSAIEALKARGVATSLEAPVEELAAALLHYIERSRGCAFDGIGHAQRDTPRPAPQRGDITRVGGQISAARRDTIAQP